MKEIGGYFELETVHGTEYHQQGIRLNSARNCLRYIIRAYAIKSILLSAYTCPAVWEAAEAERCKIEFYEIGQDLFPAKKFDANCYLVYTNYFGICDRHIEKLATYYKNLIIDNTHGFFNHPQNVITFYSARKFFGVPDGAYLYCQKQLPEKFTADISISRFSHLLGRVEFGAQAYYKDFCMNEASVKSNDILSMSRVTKKLLSGINYDWVKKKRCENFFYLHTHLKGKNQLRIEDLNGCIPMVYPFLFKREGLKQDLIENRIYIPTFWKGQKDKNFGKFLENYLIPIPIDQRYDLDDMQHILEVMDVT